MSASTIHTLALKLLSQREHSRFELRQKLKQRAFEDELIDSVLISLEAAGWQSDHRFTEQYIRMRANRGYGPVRIQLELKERGVAVEIISQNMAKCGINWLAQLLTLYQKKFKKIPEDMNLRLKHKKFLQYRGFSLDQIQTFFKNTHDE